MSRAGPSRRAAGAGHGRQARGVCKAGPDGRRCRSRLQRRRLNQAGAAGRRRGGQGGTSVRVGAGVPLPRWSRSAGGGQGCCTAAAGRGRGVATRAGAIAGCVGDIGLVCPNTRAYQAASRACRPAAGPDTWMGSARLGTRAL